MKKLKRFWNKLVIYFFDLLAILGMIMGFAAVVISEIVYNALTFKYGIISIVLCLIAIAMATIAYTYEKEEEE